MSKVNIMNTKEKSDTRSSKRGHKSMSKTQNYRTKF